MKRSLPLVMVICLFAIFSISYAKYTVDPSKEFLIADSGPSTFGYVSVYGDIVAWRAGGIFYKDLGTGRQYQISSSVFDGKPCVYENVIVWANIGGSDITGIYLYDISTGVTNRIVSSPPQPNPRNAKIYGDIVVWHGSTVAKPDIVSGFDTTTGEIFEIDIDIGGDVHGVDIYEDIVVWGNYGVWAKNLTTGESWKIDPLPFEMGDSWWPYGILLYDDLVVWKSQFIDDSGELKTWGVFGTYLSDGELLTINADPSYHSDTLNTDTNGRIVLWTKYYAGGYESSLWATDVSCGDSFLISDYDTRYGSIFGDLVVYSRDGNIYGNYIIESIPTPKITDFSGSCLINLLHTGLLKDMAKGSSQKFD